MTPRKKADRTPVGDETQAEADRRADDQDAAVEAAFLAGTLPEEDRRESIPKPVAAVISDEPEPDGSEVPLGIADAGASLHRDNATTPSVKEGQSTPPNPAGEQLKELEEQANG